MEAAAARTVDFVRVVAAVILSVALPGRVDALPVAAVEGVRGANLSLAHKRQQIVASGQLPHLLLEELLSTSDCLLLVHIGLACAQEVESWLGMRLRGARRIERWLVNLPGWMSL